MTTEEEGNKARIVNSEDRYKSADKIPSKDRKSMLGTAATFGGVGALTGWAAAGKRGGKYGLGAGVLMGGLTAMGNKKAEKRRRRTAIEAYRLGHIEGALSGEKTAADFMKKRQSKSNRYMKSMKRKKYANKGFGGSTRGKKI